MDLEHLNKSNINQNEPNMFLDENHVENRKQESREIIKV